MITGNLAVLPVNLFCFQQACDITNVVIVVTRYFGGKIGVRGLIDAYGGVAKDALEAAGIITRVITKTFQLECDYPALNSVMYHLNKYEAK